MTDIDKDQTQETNKETNQESTQEKQTSTDEKTNTVVKKPVTPTPNNTVKKEPVSSFLNKINEFKEKGNINEKSLISSIETYISLMSPNVPVTPENGMKYNRGLYQSVRNILTNKTFSHADITSCLDILCLFVNEYRNTVFHETMINRFAYMWTTQNEKEFIEYTNIMYLFMMLCNPLTRKEEMTKINFKTFFSILNDEQKQTRLTNYFKIQ